MGKENRVGFGFVSWPSTVKKPDSVSSCGSLAEFSADRMPTSAREPFSGVSIEIDQASLVLVPDSGST